MDGKMSNNKRLYRSTFSRLHYSAGIIMEDEMADNNESKRNKNIADTVSAPGARKRLRISRPIAVCAAVAALICAMSAATFAATGGETANPVQAVKVMLNGESVSATAVKADGSVLVNMGEGDVLSCEDPETGEIALKRVAQDFVNETKELVHVVINGEEIITTPGHPFYVSGKGWVGADELACGDKVILYGGQCAYVDKVSIEHLITAVKVYNFEVEDFHTYFVGDNSVLVHNKGCGFKRYSDSQLAKIVKGKFHGPGGAKKAILKDVPKDIL